MAPESLYQGVYTTKSDVWVSDSLSLDKEITPDWNVSTTVITSLACENIRLSSLFATEDVSRGGTSAFQRQKIPYWWRKICPESGEKRWMVDGVDKRQKATKVRCKREESLAKQSTIMEYSVLSKEHLSFPAARWQMNTTLYQNRPEDK